jgi:hypothetical protein
VMGGLRSPTGRRAWNRGRDTFSEGVFADILDDLSVGMTLQASCARPGAPCIATVYNWMRARPELAPRYRQAKEIGFDFIVEGAALEAPWLGRFERSERNLERIIKAAHRRCAQLAPKRYAIGVYGPVDEGF